jgi:hypothetical protein
MLTTVFRWILLRFLPRRLFPLLMAYEVYRLIRRLRPSRPARAPYAGWGQYPGAGTAADERVSTARPR